MRLTLKIWRQAGPTAAGRLEAVRKGKRDVGTQMLEIVAWGYDNDEKAEQAAREQLGKIIWPG